MAAFTDDFRVACGGSKALQWIISANAILSLALWLASLVSGLTGLPAERLYSWFSLSSVPEVFIRHPWTLVSYMFVQYGLLHLIFNLLWLFWFGRMLLYKVNDRGLARVYFGGGLLGGLAYMIVNFCGIAPAAPGSFLCGSSAAVIAVMAAAGILSPDLEVRLFLFGNVRLKWLAIVCVALTFIGVGNESLGGLYAHIGGLAFGVVFALAKKKSFRIASRIPSPGKRRNANAVANAAKGRLCDNDRLDQLLDKMKHSGFESLSKSEQNELHAISARLRKADEIKK